MRRYLYTPFAAALIMFALMLPAPAQSGAVAIRVETIDDTDREYENAKKTRRQSGTPELKEVSQTRQLQITLSNRTSQNFANLTLKYFLFTRGVDDKEVQLHKTGKRDVSLGPSATQVIKSEEDYTTYTPQHSKKIKEGGMTRFEQVPASGQKNEGYGVQVFDNRTLLAEVFDPPAVKSYIGQAEFLKDAASDKPYRGKKKRD